MKLHDEWLFKADHDIQSAKILSNSPKPLYDIAVYHTQQCAEKALKAYLTFKKQEIQKAHNLIILTNSCLEFDQDFQQIKEAAVFLNPYSTLYRYPEGDLMPTKEETEKAIEEANKIFVFVKEKISG